MHSFVRGRPNAYEQPSSNTGQGLSAIAILQHGNKYNYKWNGGGLWRLGKITVQS